ncbi:Sel-1 protein [Legionella quinlivanii]|uniref:Sel-1 protein n=1 Tax=Legionella quinlivanii TaxID=45073 RepID=A0A0W0Y471_9GAMM|nr:SEL1-like repeat protein [Legionella quinlivanii]KTD51605.1 Sel-1 protein [Legionella quinlivanii]MCW8450943.1 SEL1-like repeat protein [Legionella quinlivanii]SEF60474.1 Sel1 repeat-containing protein [Legionella quinlivanii DSM 21216]STY10868.1 Sel-1 protein [Legionella quinlivanii]
MRLVSKLIILLICCFLQTACFRAVNFDEGIACFRAENYRKAFIHLLPAAEGGQPDAQYAVGYMYYYGRGVVEDREKAWQWINRAAAAGQADARQALVILDTHHKMVR